MKESVPSSAAPIDAQDLVGDGGLKKIVVREGNGLVPPLHSRCLVHYVGRLADNGQIFMDTRQESTLGEPARIVAGRDSVLKEKGINLVVATMQVGERCHVWASPQYGYGDSGNFSFPTVPPKSHITYDIELVDFEPPIEGREQRDMTYEERLEAAERRRLEGNEAFKAGNYQESIQKYSAALAFISEDLMLQLHDFHYDRALGARLPSLLNLSACHLKLGEYHEAISAASQVIAHDPKNAKALYRRGVARHALGQTDEALTDLLAARQNAPGDPGIAQEVAAVKDTIRKEKRAQGQIFKGFVDKAAKSGGIYEEDIHGKDAASKAEGQSMQSTRHSNNRGSAGFSDGLVGKKSFWAQILEYICPWIFGRQRSDKTD